MKHTILLSRLASGPFGQTPSSFPPQVQKLTRDGDEWEWIE